MTTKYKIRLDIAYNPFLTETDSALLSIQCLRFKSLSKKKDQLKCSIKHKCELFTFQHKTCTYSKYAKCNAFFKHYTEINNFKTITVIQQCIYCFIFGLNDEFETSLKKR